MTDVEVKREFLYMRSGQETLFGWLHSSPADARPIVAVICNPLGVEYMSAYRSIRHMADRLALGGIRTLRFDYAFTGDSSGGDFSGASVAGLVADIRAAVREARQLTGEPRVVLVGIGLGATFAAMASDDGDVDHLVLWNPTASGRRFLREQKLLSEVLRKENDAEASESIDAGGVYLTPDLQEEFGKIELAKLDYSHVSSILLINRHDMQPNAKLRSALEEGGAALDQVSMHGYSGMMDYPTETVVPIEAIQTISDWISKREPQPAIDIWPAAEAASADATCMELPPGDHNTVPLVERAVKFGSDLKLFGIVSVPTARKETDDVKPAFVFLNCGSEHHAGPHRMYTILARKLAQFGALSLRFDIEGIGDSISIGNNADNESYSPVAIDDINEALDFLRSEYGVTRFILTGICAGAYHAFKASATLEDHDIVEANLVNPLVFQWNYDDPEDHLVLDARTYRTSAKSARNWWRLVRGDVDYRRLVTSVTSLILAYGHRVRTQIAGMFRKEALTGVSTDMQSIRRLDRGLTLILAEGDPGLELMRIQAPRETKRALREGALSLHTLANANHGLSKKSMQDQLITFCVEKYETDDRDRLTAGTATPAA